MTGRGLKEVVEVLESVAPLQLAESWDNVGLLIEPSSPHVVARLILTNDLTPNVMTECIEKRCDMILSYHPPIFSALKRLRQTDVKEKLVVQCIENRVAVFSPHTSYDAVNDGVNDWLINACGDIAEKLPVSQTSSDDLVACDANLLKGFESSNLPSDVIKGENLCFMSSKSYSQLNTDTPALKLHKQPVKGVGMGRRGKLVSQTTLRDVISNVKSYIGLPHLRVAVGDGKTLDSLVSSVACCAGSGSSVLAGCTSDVYLTGEMSHHEVLAITSQGISVILLEHSNSERGFLTHLQTRLAPLLPDLEIIVSHNDCDPLVIM